MQTLQRVQKDHGDARRIQCGIVQLIYTNEKSFIHDLLGLKTNAGPVGSHNLLARLQIFDLFGVQKSQENPAVAIQRFTVNQSGILNIYFILPLSEKIDELWMPS